MAQAPDSLPQDLELELKFELTSKHVRELCHAAPLVAMQAEPPKRKVLRAIYFDTPDLKLSRRGISLRVRKEGRRYIQCVKAGEKARAAGGFARHEWEWRVPGPSLDLAALRSTDTMKALFKGVRLQALTPIFSTDIRRQSRLLVTPGGAHVVCEIDRGRIVSGERETHLYELELELEKGPVGELLNLAHVVTGVVPARLSSRTKAKRGFILFQGLGAPWVRARPVELPVDATAGDVLRASLTEGLQHLIANEDCALTRAHVEGVHQMRVALRRMRSVLSTFKRLLPEGAEALRQALRTTAEALGPARDWDVFLHDLLPSVETGLASDPALALLRAEAAKRRAAAYVQVERLILSPEYAKLLAATLCWTGEDAWRVCGEDDGAAAALAEPGQAAAKRVLARRHGKLVSAGRNLAEQSPPQRHQLRIAIKKARYAAEFFTPLYAHRRTRGYIEKLKVLQDELGHLNDLAIAQRLMEELRAKARGQTAERLARAAAMIEGWYGHAQQAREDSLLKAWDTFVRTKPFW